MIIDEPLIFRVCNFYDRAFLFQMPYRKDLCRKDVGKTYYDVKVDTVWHRKIERPDMLKIELPVGKSRLILVQPHGDKYYAGWARWFNWYEHQMRPRSLCGKIALSGIWQSGALVAVLSDCDWGHLKSETEIGENFRARQFWGCSNLEIVPHEDICGDFTEIPYGFRERQFFLCRKIKNKINRSLPTNIRSVGEKYREGNLMPIIEEKQYCRARFLEILLENNPKCLKEIPQEIRTKAMLKTVATAEKAERKREIKRERERVTAITELAQKYDGDNEYYWDCDENYRDAYAMPKLCDYFAKEECRHFRIVA